MFVLSFILCFYSSLVMGQKYASFDPSIYNGDVQVDRSGQQIRLLGKSCDVLKAEAATIKTWSKKSTPKTKTPNCQCVKTKCSVDITNIVPDFVQKVQGLYPAHDGANCLNTTLVASGLVSGFRYTSSKELDFWLTSPLCSQKPQGAARNPGDIVVYKTKDENIHAAVHISKNLSFSRNGSVKFPYTFQSPENGFQAYGVEKGCEDIYQTPDSEKGCKVWANTYSCISFDDFIKQKPFSSAEQAEAWKVIDTNECSLSNQTFTPGMNQELLELTKASVFSILKLAEKKVKSAKTEEDKFIWNTIKMKADANYMQTVRLSY